MMRTPPNTTTLSIALGPAIAIATFYGLFVHRPLNHQIATAKSLLSQSTAKAARIDWDAEQRQLAELRNELKRLSEHSADNKSQQSTLVARRRDLSANLLSSTAPASSVTQILEISQSAGLTCLSVQPIKESTATIPDAWKALVTGNSDQQPYRTAECCEVLVTLSGTFPQMQNALSSLANQSLGCRILSLKMSPIDVQTDQRSWQWTVWLGSQLP